MTTNRTASHTSHRRTAEVAAQDLVPGDRVHRGPRMFYVVETVNYGPVAQEVRIFLNECGLVTPARIAEADLVVTCGAKSTGETNRILVRPGARVRFADGAMPSCEGVEFTVESVSWDNTERVPRLVAWLVRTDDLDRMPSRRRRRSAYADALRTA